MREREEGRERERERSADRVLASALISSFFVADLERQLKQVGSGAGSIPAQMPTAGESHPIQSIVRAEGASERADLDLFQTLPPSLLLLNRPSTSPTTPSQVLQSTQSISSSINLIKLRSRTNSFTSRNNSSNRPLPLPRRRRPPSSSLRRLRLLIRTPILSRQQ